MTAPVETCVENYAYIANGIIYLPHYRNDQVYVGPGYPKRNQILWTAKELEAAGAKRMAMMLWHRGTTGAVDLRNL